VCLQKKGKHFVFSQSKKPRFDYMPYNVFKNGNGCFLDAATVKEWTERSFSRSSSKCADPAERFLVVYASWKK